MPAGVVQLRSEINTLWRDLLGRQLPGYNLVANWLSAPLVSTNEAIRNVVRFMAALNQTRVLLADSGSHGCGLYLASPKQDLAFFLADWGTGASLRQLLNDHGGTNWVLEVMRWLPFEISEEELRSILLNKQFAHWTIPQTEREALIEAALACVVLRSTRQQAGSAFSTGQPARTVDIIIGSGGPFGRLAEPAAQALLLLNTLEPVGVMQLAVDSFSLLPQLGAAAPLNPQGAGEVVLNAGQVMLGACIAPTGKGQIGKDSIHLDIEYENKRLLQVDVPFGSLEVVALEPGEKATVTIRPSKRLSVGWGRNKARVILQGGPAGLIVDARGRPLPLPAGGAEMRQSVQDWHRAIGIPLELEMGGVE